MKSPTVIILIGLLVVSCAGESRTTASISEISETAAARPSTVPQTATVDVAPPPTTVALTTPRDPSLFQPLGSGDCAPPSPFLPWPDSASEGGLVEVRATSEGLEVWGLIWQPPPLPVDKEVKMVWRVTGDGDFGIRAVQGSVDAEVVGPDPHSESNFDRPGDEWGTSFVFPSPGCWEIHLTRGSAEARVWLEATDRR